MEAVIFKIQEFGTAFITNMLIFNLKRW